MLLLEPGDKVKDIVSGSIYIISEVYCYIGGKREYKLTLEENINQLEMEDGFIKVESKK